MRGQVDPDWYLEAESQIHYDDLALWECPNPITKLGCLSIPEGINAVGIGEVIVAASFTPGTVTACDAETGNLLWRERISKYMLLPPVAVEDRVLVVATDKLCFLDARSGKSKWEIEYNPSSHPAVLDGKIYIADSAGTLECIDSESGETIWWSALSRAKDPRVNGSITVHGDLIISGSNAGTISAFCLKTGELVWKKKRKLTWTHGIAIDGQVAVTSTDALTMIESSTGERVTTKRWPGNYVEPICQADGLVALVIRDESKRLPVEGSPSMRYSPEYLVGVKNGQELWRLNYPPFSMVRLSYCPRTKLLYEATPHGLGIVDPVLGVRTTRIVGFPSKPDVPDYKIEAPLVRDGRIYLHHTTGSILALNHP